MRASDARAAAQRWMAAAMLTGLAMVVLPGMSLAQEPHAPAGTATSADAANAAGDKAPADKAPADKAPNGKPGAEQSAAKKPAAAKTSKTDKADDGDDEEPPPKKAPKRFVPTEKGKADEDIPFPVDI